MIGLGGAGFLMLISSIFISLLICDIILFVFAAFTTLVISGTLSANNLSISSLFFFISLFSTKHSLMKSKSSSISDENISPKNLSIKGDILELRLFLSISLSLLRSENKIVFASESIGI